MKAFKACLALLLLASVGTHAHQKLLQEEQLLATTGRRVILENHPSDTDILNFALNLEYLEANFYSCAAFGTPIDRALWGDGGMAPTGCVQAQLTPVGMAYAKAIAADELAHVRLLRQVLGADAVDQPQMDLGAAFQAAANAAVGSTLSPSFSPYANDVSFFLGAFIFEDVGVTAYKGAAPLISNKDTLSVAAGILANEAYHGGAIRAKLLKVNGQTLFPYDSPVSALVAAISRLRSSASGANDDRGLLGDGGAFIVAPADNNAVAFSRTPAQVLRIAHLGAETRGGFFPQGTRGGLSPAVEPSDAPTSESSASSVHGLSPWGAALFSIAGIAACMP